ncbi:hypothetical protein EW146_g1974 [Bondarzewia mesenterica]|uniref:J domain-containing protein n=1 Tax=Bondarzewia mesenterica TaxID=1095465 RepID=A0A4S4M280_9AGAM|nr:hypothetical protein EW146_g1974 [Bondarzewia mesenterica]
MHYAPSTRLNLLPFQLQLYIHARLASSTSTSKPESRSQSRNNFSFPSHTNPTPHQIFHLSPGASQQEVKFRYYDLVRLHHPDSPACRNIPAQVRHARFQAITAAYDHLRGRTQMRHMRYDDAQTADELERRRRQHRRRAEYWSRYEGTGTSARGGVKTEWGPGASGDDAWKDQVILIVGFAALVVGLAPAFLQFSLTDSRHLSASRNLAQARRDAREFGEERRREIHRRVEEFKERRARSDEEEAEAEEAEDIAPFVGRARSGKRTGAE